MAELTLLMNRQHSGNRYYSKGRVLAASSRAGKVQPWDLSPLRVRRKATDKKQ
jgi:hypothetical protein